MRNPPPSFALALLALSACSSAAPALDAGYLTWTPPGLWLTAPAGGEANGIVTLTDTGDQTDQVGSITVSNASRPVFTVSASSLVVTTDGGVGVTIGYAPPSCLDGGNDTADIEFTNDSSDEPSFSLPVVGVCTPAVPDAG